MDGDKMQEPDEGVVIEEVPPEQEKSDGISDLFEAPSVDEDDMSADDVLEVDEEDIFGAGGEDLSDIVGVSDEDVIGTPRKPKPKKIYRVRRPYIPPQPPIMGGMR